MNSADEATTAAGVAGRLRSAPNWLLVPYAIACSFGVYFSMYAFRKPFDAVTYDGASWLGGRIDLKTACVVAQILGYLISKYLGAKICSEVAQRRRAVMLIGLIAVAEVGLVLFAVAPPAWKPLAMFINGLPLGMVWGLVVRYLEGRRATEVIVAGMSMSFIIAGAVTRDIGRDLVIGHWGVAANWMPAVTGAVFFAPLLATVWMLNQMPRPTSADEAARSHRDTMPSADRRAFLRRFGIGLTAMLTAYFFLTAYRDFREHYSAELLESLELDQRSSIFSKIESWALFGSVIAMAMFTFFRGHRAALVVTHLTMAFGYAVIGGSTWLFASDILGGFTWMALVGVGLYLAYVPYSVVVFERMMAGTRLAGTSVFAIQLADGIGYTGSVLIQLFRDLFHGDHDRLTFFVPLSYVVSVVGLVLIAVSGYFVLRQIER